LSGVTQQDKKPNRLSRILADAWRSRQSLSEHVAPGGAEEGGIETGRLSAAAPLARILNHIGEPAAPPRISPARGSPAWDDPPVEAVPDWDALAQPQPEYVFDQRVQW